MQLVSYMCTCVLINIYTSTYNIDVYIHIYLCLLLRRKVVDDVELLPDLLGGLPLDHRGHLGACQVEQRLYIKVVGSL
jgi:hypothetical protein